MAPDYFNLAIVLFSIQKHITTCVCAFTINRHQVYFIQALSSQWVPFVSSPQLLSYESTNATVTYSYSYFIVSSVEFGIEIPVWSFQSKFPHGCLWRTLQNSQWLQQLWLFLFPQQTNICMNHFFCFFGVQVHKERSTPVKVQQNCFTVQQIDSGETIHMLPSASISNMFLFGTLTKNNIWSPISQHDAFKNLKLIVDVLKQTAVSLSKANCVFIHISCTNLTHVCMKHFVHVLIHCVLYIQYLLPLELDLRHWTHLRGVASGIFRPFPFMNRYCIM